jgi:hypothetical protein
MEKTTGGLIAVRIGTGMRHNYKFSNIYPDQHKAQHELYDKRLCTSLAEKPRKNYVTVSKKCSKEGENYWIHQFLHGYKHSFRRIQIVDVLQNCLCFV